MTLFKAVFNGIGSGAGVAWPLFGIVFTVIGGAVGSILSFAMGGVALGLFLAVTLSIGVFSYRQMKQDEHELQQTITKNENKLLGLIDQYLKTMQPQRNEFQSLRESWQELEQKNETEPLLASLLILCKKHYYEINLDRAQQAVNEFKSLREREKLPLTKPLIASFFGFVGTFGAIAGCSAGLSGMLTGVGALTTLAAFPLIGWGVIGVAFGLGIYAAIGSFGDTLTNERQHHLNHCLKAAQKGVRGHLALKDETANQCRTLGRLGGRHAYTPDFESESSNTAVHERRINISKTNMHSNGSNSTLHIKFN